MKNHLKNKLALLVLVALVSQPAKAAKLRLSVVDSSHAPLADVLVVITNLETNSEVLRTLSDDHGRVKPLDLSPGIYRAIGTYPYGPWQTTVREFRIAKADLELELIINPQPTLGRGDVELVGTEWIEVEVTKGGKPLAHAALLIRDRSATLLSERWFKLDDRGRARVELTTGEPVLVIDDGKDVYILAVDKNPRSPLTIRLP